MRSTRPSRLLPVTIAVAFLLCATGFIATGQGFGTPGSFGAPDSSDATSDEREFATPGATADRSSEPYFLHDQLTKLLAILGFSALGVIVIATRKFRWRRWVLVASVAVLGFLIGGALCPISAVQNVILKAGTAYLLMFLVPTIAALFAGRLFCGYVCPFGALQELVHIRRLRVRIPARWMRVVRWFPYGVLIYLVARVAATGVLSWQGTTPFKAFFTLGGTPLTLAISGAFVLLSIVVFRPSCQILCPLGAWLALVSGVSARLGWGVRLGPSCVGCSKCTTSCGCDAIDDGASRAFDCLLCGECIRCCPADALSIARATDRASEDS